jgi:hypothetical protein
MWELRWNEMRNLLLVICMIITLQAAAQIPAQLLLARDTTFRQSYAWMLSGAEGAIGSPVLDRRFFDKAFFGGEIQDWHTDMLMQDMKEINRAGFYANGNLHFYGMADTIFGRSDFGLRASVGTAWYAQAGFPKGLFETIFKGNADHRGDTMQLAPFSGQFQSWQKFGLGFFHKETFSSAMISLVSGQDYQRLEVRDAGLYTSPFADSLALYYSGEYMRSDTANKGWGAGNGLGLSLDLEYNRPLATGDGFISVALQDFGWVAWNNATEVMTFDSVSTWEGYSTEQLFGDGERPAFVWEDSLYADREQGVKWRMLPFRIQVRMMKYFTKSTLMDFGMTLQPGHYSVPMVQAGLSHFLTDRMMISGRVGVGGLGTLSLGAEWQWMPGGNWLIRAGTHNAAGWMNNHARSVDAFASVGYFFRPINN